MAQLTENENHTGIVCTTRARWITVLGTDGHARTFWGVMPDPEPRPEIVEVINSQEKVLKYSVIKRGKDSIQFVTDENKVPLEGLAISGKR